MINLTKGNSISLEKDGKALENVYVGLNWGRISKWGGLFHTNVDLDGSVTMFDKEDNPVDTIFYGKKCSDDLAVHHSGDDRSGDTWKDNKDNEVIWINLRRVSEKVKSIVIYLNSYKGQEFHKIPYANIRLMEGGVNKPQNAFAHFNIPSDKSHEGKVSMIMAKVVRDNDKWTFVSIGDAHEANDIREIIKLIRHHYL